MNTLSFSFSAKVIALSIIATGFIYVANAQSLSGNYPLIDKTSSNMKIQNISLTEFDEQYKYDAISPVLAIAEDSDDFDGAVSHFSKKELDESYENAPSRYAFHEVKIPSLLTPNGDGVDDVLYVSGASLNDFNFSVYSIFGQKIYSSNLQSEGWNGTVNGSPVAMGTYIYSVSGILEGGSSLSKSSTFILRR